MNSEDYQQIEQELIDAGKERPRRYYPGADYYRDQQREGK